VSAARLDPERVSSPTTFEIELPDLRLHARFYRARAIQVETPAMVLLHGRSFPETRPARYLAPYIDTFRKAGLAVLLPTLRGWPPTGGTDDCAGRQVDDVLAVLEWLGKSSGVKSDQLFLVGYSQGAQIALLAAARGAPVQAVSAYAPVSDVASWGEETIVHGIK
jgi:dipeptidyl aminopeptidase/acylaminoacyl peptidase